MNKIICFICILFSATFSFAQDIDGSFFKGYDASFVVYNRTTGETLNMDPANSQRRFSPFSTFKIYNTLIGLELGLIKGADETWYTWDGVQRDIAGWNKDLTLREAFRVSAVPAYQILARQIGEARMKEYIQKIGYGSEDISAGIDIFWLSRPGAVSIMISADEQVALLNSLLDGKLPFSQKNVAVLRDVMQVEKTGNGTLYGKTGSGMGLDGKWNTGWFVGFLEHGNVTYVFACHITGGESPSGPVARKMVQDHFKAQGLL